MKCDCCECDGVVVKKVTRTFGKKADTIVIEGIPMMFCPACGESYFTADTLHEIERIKMLKARVPPVRHAPVLAFA